MNVYSGNGSALSTLPTGASNNFGVGLVGTSKDNLIEKNKIGGNLNGVLIAAPTQGGNVIRRNIIVGNPPVQVSKEFGASNVQTSGNHRAGRIRNKRTWQPSGGIVSRFRKLG